ncbi:phosphoglycerol transferase MdoB-like AlkP superfamily enzyme [Vreelandella songnenensis]|uniref:Phosphoglycerol transferase MdoB-like AlkP superfamily enzyme n=1 Tax=Vreelandella songnenensis TaxID=1176243 RepID=A0A2T0UZT4_9GAMM|nr:alkaline phosphatase [Halomonas songnenensis]PRY63432.1 phosphoglycerol transferase MdoB-like AlkP superfamily enzyme [Halomonas songnenensis]
MLRLLLGALALNLLLVAPLWWRFGMIGHPLVAWEAWIIVPLMLILPIGPFRRLMSVALVSWVALATVANVGDAATQMAFGRPLNLYLDTPLIRSVYHLLVGNVGQIWAICAMLAGAVLLLGTLWVLVRLLTPAHTLPVNRFKGGMALGLAVLATCLAAGHLSKKLVVPQAALPMIEATRFQWQQIVTTHRARLAFAEQLETEPLQARALPGLEGRNVLLTFVESYGVSAINDPRYSHVLLPTLSTMQQRLDARGLHVVSGLLEAPIRGGQSWLAHATLLSGRWVDNQLWYRLMLSTHSPTLIDDFKATGQRTLSIMPAITLAWPEGEAYGFDDIVVARDIDYAGPPLNWVTMPDQFTLDYTQRHLLGDSPVFAQMALISSHAPWTPILPVIEDWDTIGDGTVFAPWENAGDSPEVLWQDIERIRDHYAWSVDYAVEVTGRWAERVVDDNTLLIVLGDHQPAPLITGDEASAAVPVHIISGDPALLAPFYAHGFVDGTLPDVENPEGAARMSQLRHWLQDGFGADALPTRTTP